MVIFASGFARSHWFLDVKKVTVTLALLAQLDFKG